MGKRSVLKLTKKQMLIFGLAVVLLPGLIYGVRKALASLLGGQQSTTGNASVDLDKGLAAYWKMDGNAKDATPNAINGTITSATLTTNRKGVANSAYNFNGTTSYISMADDPALATGTMSVSAWVNQTSVVSSGEIYGRRTAGNVGGVTMETNATGAINCYFYITGTWRVASTANLSTGQWNHVVCTYDGTTIRSYVNGVASNTTAISGSINNPSSPSVWIGRNITGGGYWNGSLDEIRVYNRAITAAEVKALNENYGGGIQVSDTQKSLLGWWKMDGNAKDATPSQNHGTVTGASLTTDREGVANSAYSFNGSTNFIGMNSMSIASDITVTAWVYSTNFSQNGFIIGKNPVNTQWELFFESVLKWRGGGSDNNTTCTAPSNSAWHFIVGQQTGTTTKLYIDGVNCATATSTAIANGAGVVEIGRFNSSYYYNGSIDDVRVYNRYLSQAEITSLYGSYNAQITGSSLQKGLVAAWGFNGNAKDATPNQNNGTVNSATPTTDRKSVSNSAYSFNGTSAYITTPHGPGIGLDGAAFSVNVWVKPTTLYNYGNIFMNATGANNSGWGIITFGDGHWNFQSDPVGGSWVDIGGGAAGTLVNGTWTMLTVTFDGSNIRVYNNASLYATNGRTAVIKTNTNLLYIGSDMGSRYFAGTIDDARIWNRTLSAAEIKMLYDSYQ